MKCFFSITYDRFKFATQVAPNSTLWTYTGFDIFCVWSYNIENYILPFVIAAISNVTQTTHSLEKVENLQKWYWKKDANFYVEQYLSHFKFNSQHTIPTPLFRCKNNTLCMSNHRYISNKLLQCECTCNETSRDWYDIICDPAYTDHLIGLWVNVSFHL
jgi:hypothetical protein